MRRGMMDWQPEEVPADLLKARVQQVAEKCRSEGLSTMVLYTNFTRPHDVAVLTHFVPFWSQALLAVTATGESALVMATTGRTVQWIRSTSAVDHVAVGSQIGNVLADWLSNNSETPIESPYGVIYPENIPQVLLDQLAHRLSPSKAVDMSDWWTQASSAWRTPDAVAQQARSIALAALEAATQVEHECGHSIVAAVDGTSRSLGAEEVSVFVALDLDDSFQLRRLEGPAPLGPRIAVQVTVAYKGHWVRHTRSFERQGDRLVVLPQIQEAEIKWTQIGAAGHSPATMAANVAGALGAELRSWEIEGPVRGLPLGTLASSQTAAEPCERFTPESSLTLRLHHESGAVLWGAPLPLISFTATH